MCHTTPPVLTQHPGHDTPVPEQSPFNPFVHPLLVPQFNPLYFWPCFLNLHPMQNPFAYFPIIPHLQVCPFHAAAWYHSQQSMMGTPLCAQPMSFGIRPSVTPQSPIVQSTTTGTGTSITNNFVTFNEIGNDNSTNLKIQKNRTLSSCCYVMNMRSWVFTLGHHNTGSG